MTFTISHLFANEANLFLSIRTSTFLKVKLTVNLEKYILGYLLSVNIEKSNFVIFHPVQKQIPKKVMLYINSQSLT